MSADALKKYQEYKGHEMKRKEIIQDWKVKLSAGIVFMGLLFFTLAKVGFFDGLTTGKGADIYYILTGPLLYVVGVCYAPVWITCLLYLAYSIIHLFIAIGAAAANKPSKKEMEELLSDVRLKDIMQALYNK